MVTLFLIFVPVYVLTNENLLFKMHIINDEIQVWYVLTIRCESMWSLYFSFYANHFSTREYSSAHLQRANVHFLTKYSDIFKEKK